MSIDTLTPPETASPVGIEPRRRRTRLFVLAVVLLACAAVGGVWLYNELTLARPLNRIMLADSRNQVVKARAHYDGWIDFNTVVFDISDVAPNATRMDVFRCFLQFAEQMKNHPVKRVMLSARGKRKFWLDGDYFHQIGEEYETQNPVYTVRTFPLHLKRMDGSQPFEEYTGGIFAVLGKEMEQFTEFHDEWYVRDFAVGGQ